tara:strand:+ start:619 stop:792 length:174 start_codon:yes stop_codon:yes gene_type:complete
VVEETLKVDPVAVVELAVVELVDQVVDLVELQVVTILEVVVVEQTFLVELVEPEDQV